MRKNLAAFSSLVVALSLLGTFSTAPQASAALTDANCAATVTGVTASAIASGDDCIITFSSGSGTWTIPSAVSTFKVLVVGGGGGGGADAGSGGGGGAYYVGSFTRGSDTSRSFSIVVGAGGDPAKHSNGAAGTNGSASSFTFTDQSSQTLVVTASGGGKGAFSGAATAATAGSGGSIPTVTDNSTNASITQVTSSAGGDGGAGVAYNSTNAANNGAGGTNALADFSGSFGGGGGGGATEYSATSPGRFGGTGRNGGGNGGGGFDGANATVFATAGTANSGGGGGSGSAHGSTSLLTIGGESYYSRDGKAGGSGVVKVRYSYALGTPSAPDLDSASDSGFSTTDNITNDTTPTFTGTATAGSTIQLLVGGVATGDTCTASSAGAWSCTAGAQSSGTKLFTVSSTFGFGTSTTSSSLSVQILTGGPGAATITRTNGSAALGVGETATISFATGRSIYDFIVGDVTVTGGSLSNFIEVNARLFTATFTPTPNSADTATITVSANKFMDLAGDGNTASTALSIAFNTYSACVPSATTSDSYTVVSITDVTTCNWVTPSGISQIEAVVVGGGGGGGFGSLGGGGGAGEVLVTGSSATLSGTTVTNTSTISTTPGATTIVSVGGGGATGAPSPATDTDAATQWNANNTTFKYGGDGSSSSFGSVTALGGGGGGGGPGVSNPSNTRLNGAQGGSGGGGATGGTGGAVGSNATPANWKSFKYAGSNGSLGGGGGAGGAGSTTKGGYGVTVWGIRIAGGGGGWSKLGSENSLTDTVLGGNGRLNTGSWGYAGTSPNWTSPGKSGTGTGGGAGAPGGSGIVIIRYANVVNYSYNANNGSGSAPSSGSVQGGTSFTTASNPYSRNGYTFGGWNTAANGSGTTFSENTSSTMPVSATSITLYAQWTATAVSISTPSAGLSGTVGSSYSLSMSSSGGTGSGSYSIVTGSLPTGVSLDTSTGVISGTPTLGGTFPLTIRFTDTNASTATTSSFSIVISALKLSTPTSLAVTTNSGGGSAITVTFNFVTNASSYKAQIFDANSSQIGSDYASFTSGSTISGLTPGTAYSVKVFAVGDGTSYSNSDATSAATFTTPAAYYLTFAGSGSNYASVTGRTIIPSTGNFTAEAWISPTEYGSSRSAPVILSQGATGSRFYLKLNSSGYLIAFQEGGTNEIQCSNAAIPLNIWTHVAFVKTSSTASCYVNGTLQTSNTPTSTLGSTAIGSGFFVGAYSASASASGTLFKGQIDEVKIWNTSRTQTQINSNKEIAPLLSDSTLIAYFPFDATTGTSAIDMKDSANNLTLRTTMTWLPLVKTISYSAGSNGSGTTPSQSGSNDHSNSLTLKLAADATGITRSNYSISAWNTDAGGTSGTSYALGATYTGTSDLTLYPTWLGATKTITYSAGTGGSGSAPSTPTSVAYGSTFTTPANTYSRTGYTFAGWSDGTNVYSASATYPASGTVSANVTLTATWTVNSLSISFAAGTSGTGSAPTSPLSVNYGDTFTTPANTYSRTNYGFAGWSDGTNVYAAGATYPSSGTVTSAVTLTATWTINSLTVTYNSQGGTSVSSGSVNVGASISSAPTSPTKSGYTFSGWSDTTTGTVITFPYAHGQTANFTLYAIWSPDALTITYDSLGGTSVNAGSTTSGGSITIAPTPPTKSNYTFAGWSATNGGSAISFPYTHGNTSNFTLYARWTANVYTLTYFYNSATGGNSTETATATTGGSSITLPTPTRTGYTFAGWYSESTFTTSIGAAGATYMPTGSSLSPSAYAKWTAINYSVTYATTDSTSGSSPTDTTNYNIGNSVVIKGNTGPLVRTGYSLAGWTAASDGSGTVLTSGSTYTVASSNMTFYPKWSANTYTVTYNKNGASGAPTAATSSYTTGGTAVTLTTVGTMAKTGFNFGGWATTPTGSALVGTYTTSADVTLYAVWTIKSISITFAKGDASSSTFFNFPAGRSANYGTTITLNDTVDSAVDISGVSHAFMGWNDGTSVYQSGATYLMGESAPTFTATWVKVFAVRYAFNGGTAAAGSSAVDAECLQAGTTCTDGQVITANAAPTRTGYTFAGWVDQNGVAVTAGGTFTVRSNRYLIYATWTAVDYSITYSTNGGSAAPTESTKQMGQTFTVASTPTKTGYNFNGWSDGTSTYGAGTTYYVGSSAVTLTAQWTPKVYTVIYDWNGGSGSTTNNDSFTVGTSAITLPVVGDHVKDGYTFSGWSETTDGTLISGGYTPASDKTLYAIWGTGSYTITYNANGGSVGTSSAAVQNGLSLTLPTPTRSKFVFEGWFTASSGGTRIGSVGATHQPTQSRTLYAQWTQSSLYGLNPASLSRINTTTVSSGSSSSFTVSNANSAVSVTVPAGSLPNGTNIYFDLVGDFSRAQSVLTGTNSYIISLVVSWLATDGTVPDTAADKAISVTISNSSIRSGMKVYGIVAGEVTLLGTATQYGTVTVSVTSDPEVVVVATKPGAPTSVAATSNATQQSVISWTAPTSDGGSAITSYTVTANSGQTCTTALTTCTITGLADGISYTFTVTATNALGTSDASSAATGRTANASVSGGSSGSSSSSSSSSTSSESSSRSNVTVASSVVVVGDKDAKVLSVDVSTSGANTSAKPASIRVDAKSKTFISEVKIVEGKLTLTPETGFSGKRIVTVTISENGSERFIQVPLTVLPEPVSKPIVTPASSSKSIIRWTASPNADEYTVFVDGTRVCVKATTSCSVSKLVGPNSLIEIVAKGGDRTYSEKVEADFQQTKPVLVSRLVTSTTPKAILTRADQAALDKVIAVVKSKGFGTVQISNVSTTKKTESVAQARLAAIKKYLAEKSGLSSLVIETAPATAKTYFNNISVKE